MYSNDSVYDVTGSDNTSIVLCGLMPEENYFILVRAYQDILGPATALDIATDDGNHRSQCDNLSMYSLYLALTIVMSTLISPITSVTGLTYEVQCETNTVPDTLTITVDSMPYNITQQFIGNTTYISEVTITEFTGADIIVQCIWNIDEESFVDYDIYIIEGELK